MYGSYRNDMRTHLLSLLLAVCGYLSAQAQEVAAPQPIILHNATFAADTDLGQAWPALQQVPHVVHAARAYVLLQLKALPSTAAKQKLANRGIRLLHYVPNATWLAEIDLRLTVADLEAAGVHALAALPPAQKMPAEMAVGDVPAYAGYPGGFAARANFLQTGGTVGYAAICRAAGLQVQAVDERWHRVDLSGSLAQFEALARHPLVLFIEWPDPPVENEVLNERTLIQSNYISENPGKGYYFDGTGDTLAVNEGGRVNAAENPNFKGRLDRSFESGNNSGHKTGVGRRMASAGNIDPTLRGTAFGATLQSGGINFSNAAASGVAIVNNSFGWGCISGSVTYNSGAATNDNLVRNHPGFMVTYSCGNMGGADCGWGAGAGWSNITGLTKSGKNIFAVGALNTAGNLTGFSSRGPARDGRILPDVCATGPGGTSHASPNLAGVYVQLRQAWAFHAGGGIPPSGLIKAIILNTADDMLNPGPDFKTGFGKLNARRAYEVIRQGTWLTDTVSQGNAHTHTITVPANVKEVRVMTYWTDYEATIGITGKALVNDLTTVLNDPSNTDWNPWVLDPTPNATTLDLPAVRGIDTLNNVEQITLQNPAPGNYDLTVTGTLVPQGPQLYNVVWEFVYDEVVVAYPAGGEHFVPGETERLRWESLGDAGSFTLSWSADNGQNWTQIATGLSSGDRFYDWSVPNTATGQALIRVSRGAVTDESDTTFHILEQPQNLGIGWSCADSSLFVWDSVPGADGYIVYRLGPNYMDSVAYSTDLSQILHNFSAVDTEYVAVAAVLGSAISRRVIAIERPPANLNCVIDDLSLTQFLSPGSAYLPDCMQPDLMVEVLNVGVNAVTLVPVGYRINGGPVMHDTAFVTLNSQGLLAMQLQAAFNPGPGTHVLEAWTQLPGDVVTGNDTTATSFTVYASNTATLPLTENFDAFTTCSTAWGCSGISCNLSGGWYNIPNATIDTIDWRTDANGTGTGSTGPSGDHTSGSGNYLYLEGSGNGGSGCRNHMALLYSPCFDLSCANQPKLTWWYHAFGSAIGSLHVDIIADGQLYEDVVPPVIGAQGNAWVPDTADLSAFVGKQIVAVFRGWTGNGFQADLAIDDIGLYSLPASQFSASQTNVCIGQQVQLLNTSCHASSYEWSVSPATFSYQNSTNNTSTQPELSFNAPGTYSIQLTSTNAFGTDSLLQTAIITVAPAQAPIYVNDMDTTWCAGDPIVLSTDSSSGTISWFLNGALQHSGTDTFYDFAGAMQGDLVSLSYQINAGCTLFSDTIALNVISIDTSVTVAAPTLTANQTSGTYQWVDCNNGFSAIAGATTAAFTPTISGLYACVLTDGGCTDTTTCYAVTIVSTLAPLDSDVSVFPNPATKTLSIHSALPVEDVRVHNALGELVLREKKDRFSVEMLSSGVYFIRITTANGVYRKRFVKE